MVLDRIHGGVVHNVLDTLLLDLLEKLASIGGGVKFFSGGYKHELFLDILDCHHLNEDSLDGGLVCADLGHCDVGGLVAVHAGSEMDR